MSRTGRIAIALGDPAGIGAEVTLRALARLRADRQRVLLVGCRRWLVESHRRLRNQG
jgi:4-hydroxythreonine-4-phosphate dehydrogenase